ncbi:DUF3006 domain-containing protein [Cohnella sp. WQ 127256]|uniref:DUF3006 domain-containing protein n=1 Tax=Cohnella sp. WQ 127256 TaxID=2938790 RepID=UPI0021182F88|nr:DUF3006 domain-containing protein [Cohnella sp. WQ 127256]
MKNGVIDRFEDDIVVIEIDGETRDFPRESIPHDAKVGDSILFDNGEIRLDPSETTIRKREIKKLMDDLFE